jgi:hypothetical protein
MGVLDKIKDKLDRKGHSSKHAHEQQLVQDPLNARTVEPSINVPLEEGDMFHTTGLVTDDPLKDKRYTSSGLRSKTAVPDTQGLIQGMEHLAVAGQERDVHGLLRGMSPALSIKCGPLLRYVDTDFRAAQPMWQGSVMIVAIDNESDYASRPSLRLSTGQDIPGEVLYTQFGSSFWRFSIQIPLQDQEQRITYCINGSEQIVRTLSSAASLTIAVLCPLQARNHAHHVPQLQWLLAVSRSNKVLRTRPVMEGCLA